MKAKKSSPLPNAACEKLAAIAPFITDRARELAAERLGMSDEKVALLIVKAINPYEILTLQEQAVLRGVTRKTLSKMLKEGTTRPIHERAT